MNNYDIYAAEEDGTGKYTVTKNGEYYIGGLCSKQSADKMIKLLEKDRPKAPSVKIKCPFFMYDGTHFIKCEGVDKDTILSLETRNVKVKKTYTEEYCKNNYESCKIHQMLMEKY